MNDPDAPYDNGNYRATMPPEAAIGEDCLTAHSLWSFDVGDISPADRCRGKDSVPFGRITVPFGRIISRPLEDSLETRSKGRRGERDTPLRGAGCFFSPARGKGTCLSLCLCGYLL